MLRWVMKHSEQGAVMCGILLVGSVIVCLPLFTHDNSVPHVVSLYWCSRMTMSDVAVL